MDNLLFNDNNIAIFIYIFALERNVFLMDLARTMMRNISFITIITIFLSFISCSKDDKAEPVVPSINVAIEGDAIFLDQTSSVRSYTITISNQLEDQSISGSLSDSSWIHILKLNNQLLEISVSANDNTSVRNTVLTLRYPGAEPRVITISQRGKDLPTFDFKIDKLTYNGVSVSVIPSDKTFEYTWNLISKRDIKKYKSDNEIIAKLIENIKLQLDELKEHDPMASIYDLLVRADDERRINSLEQDTEYTLLAVGIDPKKMVPITDLAKFDFKTKPFEIVDPCKFDISFSDVTTTGFTFTIVPSSNKTRYYYGICPAEILEKEGKDQVAEDLIRVRDNHGEYDWSRHNALTVNKIVVNTDDMRLPAPLKPNKPYAIVVFGVNDLGARTTEVGCKIQRTTEAKPLDMTFEFELLKQTEQGAILKITPSIKTAPYMVGCIKKQQYSQYVGKDDEFISYVIKSANIETVKGDCTLDKTHKLISDTEYVCFAFGYDGAPTTKLCTFPFRTGKMAQEGNLQMKLKDVKVEPSTSDVSKATVTFIIEPQEGVEHWSAQVFQTENGVVVGRFGVTMTDNEVAEYLFNPTNKYKTEDKKEIKATVDWDTEVTCYSIAIDKSGKKGPLTKFKYVVKKK